MATAFSNHEKEEIKARLKEVAREDLGQYGVRRTTVDQIVKKAGIAKGSFYNFYSQKEILFFEVLEDYQKEILNKLKEELKEQDNLGVDEVTELVYNLYQGVSESFILTIIQNQEFDILLRKLPKEVIIDHHSLDDLLIKDLLSYLNVKEHVNMDVVNGSLRAIFLTMLHQEEIGEEDFDEVLEMLIRGVIQQIMIED